jgi:hypothetical protein
MKYLFIVLLLELYNCFHLNNIKYYGYFLGTIGGLRGVGCG